MSLRDVIRCRLLVAAFCFSALLAVSGQSSVELPTATADRVDGKNWWPTKGTPAFEAYAGEGACMRCHSKEAASQATTPMARASFRADVSANSPKLSSETLQSGSYVYELSSNGPASKLVVSAGKQSIAANVGWIFGAGVYGRTYILERKGTLYESQVSSFAALHGMDITPGHVPVEEGNLQNAMGEGLSVSAGAQCFACHTTASTTQGQFDPKRAMPGVGCEACHGPGVAHVMAAKMELVDEAEGLIVNSGLLSPADSVDFCGACHRTSMDVVKARSYGPANVRFQPYRLEKSRCWGPQGDERLVCIACHNPHQPLVRSASFYDQRCLSCHGSHEDGPHGSSSPLLPRPSYAVCPKATANCTTCHMPKYEVAEMHGKFTDHFIRIVRDGEPYPN